MKPIRILCLTGIAALLAAILLAQIKPATPGTVKGAVTSNDLAEGFRLVEVASVSDAIEQLYNQRAYLSHDMRPVFKTKFAGPAVTVLMKKEEHTEGSKA